MLSHVWSKDSLRRLLELFVLTGFVVAQPIYDMFGKSADHFVFRSAGRGDILQWTVIVLLLPALALWLVECIVGIVHRGAARAVHVVLVGALAALLVIQTVRNATTVRGAPAAAIAVIGGAALALLYVRWQAARTWVAYAAPAPLAFALLFVFATPVNNQVFPDVKKVDTASVATDAPSVVMVVLDEFPLTSLIDDKGELDQSLYPNFARLAASSNFYANATSNAWYTPFAVPAILTGSMPSGDKVPSVVDYPRNLFTLFGDGYEHNVHEILQMCPQRLCKNAGTALGPGGLRPLLEDAQTQWRKTVTPDDSDEDITVIFGEDVEVKKKLKDPKCLGLDCEAIKNDKPLVRWTAFLDSLDGSAAHSVNFVHMLMPHSPWKFLPDGTTYAAPEPQPGLVDGVWTADRSAEVARQRHLQQARFTDKLIGELIDQLQKSKMWERSVVVVTADHGLSFAKGQNKRDVSDANYQDIAWVPLFIKAPSQTSGKTSQQNAQSIDILPTVAEMVGAKTPSGWDFDGRSLLGAERPVAEKRKFLATPKITREVDGEAGLRLVRANSVQAFAPDRDPEMRLFRRGAHAELIGRKVSELRPGPAAPGTATIANAKDYAAVQLAVSVPAYTYGSVDGGDADTPVVIAVNGVVGAVSDTFDADGKTTFVALVSQAVFRQGRNDVAVYSLGDDGSLRPFG